MTISMLTVLALTAPPLAMGISSELSIPWGSSWNYCQTSIGSDCVSSQTGHAGFGGGAQSTCSNDREPVRTNWDLHTRLRLRKDFTVPVTAKTITFHWQVDDNIGVEKETSNGNVVLFDPPTQGNCDLAPQSKTFPVALNGTFYPGEQVHLLVTVDDYYSYGMSYFDMRIHS